MILSRPGIRFALHEPLIIHLKGTILLHMEASVYFSAYLKAGKQASMVREHSSGIASARIAIIHSASCDTRSRADFSMSNFVGFSDIL